MIYSDLSARRAYKGMRYERARLLDEYKTTQKELTKLVLDGKTEDKERINVLQKYLVSVSNDLIKITYIKE